MQLHANSIYVSIPGSSASEAHAGSDQSSFDGNPISLIQERLAALKGVRHAYDGSVYGYSSQSSVAPVSTISPESSVSRTYSITRKIKAMDHLEERTRLHRGGSLSGSSTDYQRRLRELESTSIASYESQLQRSRTDRSSTTAWSRESAPDLARLVQSECNVSDVIGFGSSGDRIASRFREDMFAQSEVSDFITTEVSGAQAAPSSSEEVGPTTPKQSPSRALNLSVMTPKLKQSGDRESDQDQVANLLSRVEAMEKLSLDDLNGAYSSDAETFLKKIEGLKAYLDQSKLNQFHSEIDDLTNFLKQSGSQRLLRKSHELSTGEPEAQVLRNEMPAAVVQNEPRVPLTIPSHDFYTPQAPPVTVLENLTVLEPSVALKLPKLLNRLESLLEHRGPLPTTPLSSAQTLDLQPIMEKIESCFAASHTANLSNIPPAPSQQMDNVRSFNIPPSKEEVKEKTSNTSPSEQKDVHRPTGFTELCEKIDSLSAACLKSARNGSSSYMQDSLVDRQQQMLSKVRYLPEFFMVLQLINAPIRSKRLAKS